ncbi:MAG: polysaccharide deacetylase family protein [Clostridiaceae bacterium]|nr:polysaccharide deacetylase family protein [Clostridiaceae bacterium]
MRNCEVTLPKGIFVLSLDVELCWGTIDKPDKLKNTIKYYTQSRDCIEKILKLVEKYNISATWAVVGHLFLKECNSINGQKHSDIPRSTYPWYSKDWFEESPCTNEEDAPLWYGQDIIKMITNCKVRQEIACHSFAHIPYGDENTKRETVQADLSNCIQEAEKEGLKLRSFVFPRNNVGYIDEVKNYGFEAYRGAEPTWYRGFPNKRRKVCHIIDQLLAMSPPVGLPEYEQGIYNIPGSMLYRSMNGFRSLIPLKSKIHKARRGIRRAIRDKKIFHLWFHPFNIATNQEKLLYGLEEMFKEVCAKRENGELEIKSMDEIVDLIKYI